MTSFTVATFGFGNREDCVLKSVLAISSSREPTFTHYAMTDSEAADIVLVNADTQDEDSDWQAYKANHQTENNNTVITVSKKGSKQTDGGSNYQLCRPILASRLLSLLESVVTKELGYTGVTVVEPETSGASQSAVRSPRRNLRALVVDDSLPARLQLKNTLQGIASQIDLAETGEEAVGKLAKGHYDIVFLDTILPGIDGYKVCKLLKKNPKHLGVPVVMISASNSPAHWLKSRLAGCDACLPKPIKVTEFEETLEKCLTPKEENIAQPSPLQAV